MTTEDTIFKFNGGYILLKDLEALDAQGIIGSDEKIYIADHLDAFFLRIDLKTLRRLYGDEKPFRRELRADWQQRVEGPSNGLGVSNTDVPSASESQSNETKQPEQPISSEVVNGELLVYVDYPLFHVETFPEGESITGELVLKEMEKLKAMIPLENFSSLEKIRFSWLCRQNERVAICRLCGFTPYSAHLFFKHLFSYKHCQRLSKSFVPKSDFAYWEAKFAETPEEPIQRFNVANATESSVDQTNVEKSLEDSAKKNQQDIERIPLLAGTPQSSILLTESQLGLLSELYSRMDTNYFGNKGSYWVQFLNSIQKPNFCDICHVQIHNTPCEIAKHILTGEHLEHLKSVKCARGEYNFWINLMRIQLNAKETPMATITRIFKNRNNCQINLIDFKLESDILEESVRREKLDALRKLWASVPRKTLSTIKLNLPFDNNPNATCYACDLPKLRFPTREAFIEHILTEKHVKFLLTFGFSDVAWNSVMTLFRKCIETAGKQSAKELRKSEKQNERKRETIAAGVVQVEIVPVNSERVPLLDFPPHSAQLFIQRDFMTALKKIRKIVDERGKKLENDLLIKSVDWQCAYCSTEKKPVVLTTELQAIRHILNQRHKEKMRFRSSSADISFWVNRLTRPAAVEVPTKPETSVEEPERKPSEQKIDAEQLPIFPKAIGNNPRVAMLDAPPSGQPTLAQNSFVKELQNIHLLFQNSGENFTDFISKMSVDWKCAFCERYGQQVTIKNQYEALSHILTEEHRLKIVTTVQEDLDYWKDWINRTNEDIAIQAENKRKGIRQRPTNTPRVELLDVPSQNQSILTQQHCATKYYTMRDKFRELDSSLFQQKMPVSKCFHCEGSREMATTWEVLDHVFNEKHIKSIMHVMSISDFEHWERILSAAAAKHSAPEVIPTVPTPAASQQTIDNTEVTASRQEPLIPTVRAVVSSIPQPREVETPQEPPTDPLQRPDTPVPVAPIPRPCRLPLFSKWTTSGAECPGPTVAQIRIAESKNTVWTESLSRKCFANPTICGVCNIEMTLWTLDQVLSHAFSPQHLRKIYATGIKITCSDYKYWLDRMNLRSTAAITIGPECNVHIDVKQRRLGVKENPFQSFDVTPVVTLTPEQTQLLDNFNVNKLDQKTKEKLLQEYGMCHECNVWIPYPEKIIPHFVSTVHFHKMRISGRMVRMGDINPLLEYAKMSSARMCIIM